MANTTSKKKTSAKKTAHTVMYRGQTYKVLERNDHHVCLTDGLIHFWVKVKDVEGN